ncbi:MAG: TonB-dependent receptor plug domain-containing protein [Reichenbachiella sp.]
MKLSLGLYGIIFCLFSYFPSIAQKNVEIELPGLFDMSLEELLQIKTSMGSMSQLNLNKVPASITIIDSDKIQTTHARNLLDLIEVYVPGAMWFNNVNNYTFGMRGVISKQNNKYILLVNGKNMNLKTTEGMASEVENWDMGDIEKVEIIRGPGSVTYGPGAIGGIINIITKTAFDQQGFRAVIGYNYPYQSSKLGLSYGYNHNDWDVYAYGSVTSTQGIESEKSFSMKFTDLDNAGFIGSEYGEVPPIDYMADNQDIPQFKVQLSVANKQWTFWNRFTNSGGSKSVSEPKIGYQTGLDNNGDAVIGNPENWRANKVMHYTSVLQNELELGDALKLNSRLSFDIQDYQYYKRPPLTVDATASSSLLNAVMDKEHTIYRWVDFAESEINLRSIMEYSFKGNSYAAIGLEMAFDEAHKGWGDNVSDLRMGDNRNIISDEDSKAYTLGSKYDVSEEEAIFIGNGFSMFTTSLIGEVNWSIANPLSLLLSGRLDFNTETDPLFSPRLALVWSINERNVLKGIVQRALRMNTMEQLIQSKYDASDNIPEVMNSIEMIFITQPSKQVHLGVSGYYNQQEIIDWERLFGQNLYQTHVIGDLKVMGVEIELTTRLKKFEIGINHAFIHMLDWQMKEGVERTSISYGHYGYRSGQTNEVFSLGNYGDNLNNWADNTSKLFVNWQWKQFRWHTDMQIFWNYQGKKDGIEMVKNQAHIFEELNEESGNPFYTYTEIQPALERIEEESAMNTNVFLATSISYVFNDRMTLSFYGRNLLKGKRYNFDLGHKSLVPRVQFIEEPTMFGVEFNLQF